MLVDDIGVLGSYNVENVLVIIVVVKLVGISN